MSSINFEALAAPFAPTEIEWRVGQTTKAGDKATLLAYLTSRAVQARLDDVCGVQHWRDSYTPICEGPKVSGFLCTLEIEVEPGVWVGKSDASDTSDIEALKGGVSGALKRAAVKWGIGRYLYDLETRYYPIREGYGPDHAIAAKRGKDGPWGHILPPSLPDWALPSVSNTPPRRTGVEPHSGVNGGTPAAPPPDPRVRPASTVEAPATATREQCERFEALVALADDADAVRDHIINTHGRPFAELSETHAAKILRAMEAKAKSKTNGAHGSKYPRLEALIDCDDDAARAVRALADRVGEDEVCDRLANELAPRSVYTLAALGSETRTTIANEIAY